MTNTSKIIHGDCIEELKKLEENSVHSIVTDPPYGLSFMGKKWDYDVPSVEMWQEAFRVLKPGGHLLSFAGSRTYHRMAVNIEDAGFEVRDMITWNYGSGFPKSHNIFKALKKRCECGNMEVYEKRIQSQRTLGEAEAEYNMRLLQYTDIQETESTNKEQGKVLQSELSEQDTHRTMQGQEPQESTNGGEEPNVEGGNNLQKTEGELQGGEICEVSERISENGKERRLHNGTQTSDGETPEQITNKSGSSAPHRPQSEQQQYKEPCAFCKQFGTQAIRTLGYGTALKPSLEPIVVARKPFKGTVANNVLEHGTGGINIDGCRVETEDKMKVNKHPAGTAMSPGGGNRKNGETVITPSPLGRFPANFIHDGLDDEQGEWKRYFYVAKASKSERNKGLEGFEEKETKRLGDFQGTPEHAPKLNVKNTNHHPTVKPVKLMQYLVRLVTPKNGTVLDPFLGSGTTGIACKLEGFDFIGIEREEEYIKIAEARIDGWETLF